MRFLASRFPAQRPGRSGLAVACERTAQRSIKRLMDRGHLRRDPVPVPDPDDPRNMTGYRYYFNWHVNQPPAIGPRGGVTKERGGVTKPVDAPPDPPAEGGGGVTKELGDSVVTQVRSEVLELETLTYGDVAAFAEGEGEPSMPTEPAAIVEAPPAPALTDEDIATQLGHLRNPRSPLRRFAYRILEGGVAPARIRGPLPAANSRVAATDRPARAGPIARDDSPGHRGQPSAGPQGPEGEEVRGRWGRSRPSTRGTVRATTSRPRGRSPTRWATSSRSRSRRSSAMPATSAREGLPQRADRRLREGVRQGQDAPGENPGRTDPAMEGQPSGLGQVLGALPRHDDPR